MTDRDNELKARMLAEAEAAIEALLAKRETRDELSLTDIERLVREAGQRVMGRLTAELADEEAVGEGSTVCPECGHELIYKGRKARHLVTDTGEVRIERNHYYCPTCRKGVFPPRPSVGAERDEL
jgi:predicted RNA-binding Zn-ribbon protein involved in translation (DUF1610 family)